MENHKSGADLIRDERIRQVYNGYTDEHDDEHSDGSLLRAARCYTYYVTQITQFPSWGATANLVDWPWEPESYKPTYDPIPNLVKAGALIAAEIDRLQRIQAAEQMQKAAAYYSKYYPDNSSSRPVG